MRPSPAATAAVRDATRSALQSEAGLSAVLPSLGPVAVTDFLAAARRQRVTAVLAAQAAAIGLPDEVCVALLDTRPERRFRALRQVRCLAEVARVLERSDIPAIFFKGPCLAMQTTGDVTARDAGDIDVLIAPSAVAGAIRALERAGWTRRLPPNDPRSFGWRYLIWAGYELALDGPLGNVDLHWRLDPAHEALPTFDALWERRSAVEVGDAVFASLGPEDALAHSCHHAAKDSWRWLRSLVDVHRLLRETGLRTEGGETVADATVAVVEALIGLPVRAEGARAAPRRAEQAVRAALRAQEGPVRMHPPPGFGTYRSLRFSLASGHGTANAVRALAVATIPPSSFAGNGARTAPVALARAIPRRVSRVTLRVLGRVESAAPVGARPWSAREL